MPCEDKSDSQSPVLNLGRRNDAKGALTNSSLGKDDNKLPGSRQTLGFEPFWNASPSRRASTV